METINLDSSKTIEITISKRTLEDMKDKIVEENTGIIGSRCPYKFLAIFVLISSSGLFVTHIQARPCLQDNTHQLLRVYTVQLLNFICPISVVLLALSELAVFLLLISYYLGSGLCSIVASDKLILFVAGFTLDILKCKPNMEIHTLLRTE